jgi:hypothetical protein
METLMIHDLSRAYFDLPLERYRLSFDDGLYSQYFYYPVLSNHPETLTYFITTGFIRPGPARERFAGSYLPHLKTSRYARQAFIEGDYGCFMTSAEVRFLADQPKVRIGAHSHWHDVILTDVHPKKKKAASAWKIERMAHVPEALREGLAIRSRLAFKGFEYVDGRLAPRTEAEWTDYIRRDTERCLSWFRTHLGREPNVYCFPFNEYTPPLVEILKGFGFREFYAARASTRLPINGRVDVDRLL